eukprot:Selendium_serpulae@DN1512_c0_g1_i1.p2
MEAKEAKRRSERSWLGCSARARQTDQPVATNGSYGGVQQPVAHPDTRRPLGSRFFDTPAHSLKFGSVFWNRHFVAARLICSSKIELLAGSRVYRWTVVLPNIGRSKK